MRKLWVYLRYFLGTSKTWRRPRRSDVLIFDASHENLLREYVGSSNPEVLHVRGELLNMPTMLASLVRRGRKLEAYFDCFIERVSPRLIVTMIDNNLDFMTLSRRHPGVKTLSIQNGWRTYVGDIFETLDRLEDSRRATLFVDYMMVFGSAIAAEYGRFVAGSIVPMGSIKNNRAPRSQTRLSGVIALISQWRSEGVTLGSVHYPQSVFFGDTDRPIVRFLADYARKYGKRFMIVPVNPKQGAQRRQEEAYFRDLAGHQVEFLEPSGPFPSYQAADGAEIVVAVDSTLAYESIARGNKTAVFCIRSELLGVPSQKYGWPGDFPAKGPFWTSRADPQEFKRIIDRLCTIDDSQWRADVEASGFSSLMAYDPGNTILSSVLATELSSDTTTERNHPIEQST